MHRPSADSKPPLTSSCNRNKSSKNETYSRLSFRSEMPVTSIVLQADSLWSLPELLCFSLPLCLSSWPHVVARAVRRLPCKCTGVCTHSGSVRLLPSNQSACAKSGLSGDVYIEERPPRSLPDAVEDRSSDEVWRWQYMMTHGVTGFHVRARVGSRSRSRPHANLQRRPAHVQWSIDGITLHYPR